MARKKKTFGRLVRSELAKMGRTTLEESGKAVQSAASVGSELLTGKARKVDLKIDGGKVFDSGAKVVTYVFGRAK